MNALVVHADLPTVAMESVIALAGLLLGVGLIWTIRFRSASADAPAIALRRADEAPGSAQTTRPEAERAE